MSDEDDQPSFEASETPRADDGRATSATSATSAGRMLRELRESHGLPVEVVAQGMKVSVAKIEALENDQIDRLPDPAFARALAASICRAFQVDPAPVLARMPGKQPAGLAERDRTISRNLRSSGPRGGLGTGSSSGVSRTVLVVVALLLVAAAVIVFLPSSLIDRLNPVGSERAATAGEGASTSPNVVSEPASVPAAVLATPASAVVAAAPSPASAPVSTAPASTPVAAAPQQVLVFTAREDSWVTVDDGNRKPVLRRIIKSGETVGIDGNPPFSVVVGRAAGIDVTLRGKPYPLGPLTKQGGVARFEVKP